MGGEREGLRTSTHMNQAVNTTLSTNKIMPQPRHSKHKTCRSEPELLGKGWNSKQGGEVPKKRNNDKKVPNYLKSDKCNNRSFQEHYVSRLQLERC